MGNVGPNIAVNWIMGYLNFQIEHHLFPGMPNFASLLCQSVFESSSRNTACSMTKGLISPACTIPGQTFITLLRVSTKRRRIKPTFSEHFPDFKQMRETWAPDI